MKILRTGVILMLLTAFGGCGGDDKDRCLEYCNLFDTCPTDNPEKAKSEAEECRSGCPTIEEGTTDACVADCHFDCVTAAGSDEAATCSCLLGPGEGGPICPECGN